MKKILIPVAIAAVLFGAYKVVSVAKDYVSLKDINYKIKSVNINKSKTSIQTLALDINTEIINPSTIPVKLKSVNLNIYFKGKRIGMVTNFQEIVIVPQTVTSVKIPVSIPTVNMGLSMAQEILDWYKNKDSYDIKTLLVNIKGSVRTDLGSLTIDETKSLG